MSSDDTDDLMPGTGFNAHVPDVGDTDWGLPIFPEAVWLAQMGMSAIDSGEHIGVAYRLMWGEILDDGSTHLDGELWLDCEQMRGLFEYYVEQAPRERERGG